MFTSRAAVAIYDNLVPFTLYALTVVVWKAGYVVEGSPELNDVCLVKADQSDEAELEAVAFAIQELKEKLHRFTVISDHESVVSEIKRGRARPSSRPRLAQVQLELESHQSIQVDFLGKNPAHTLLNQKKHALDRVRRQT